MCEIRIPTKCFILPPFYVIWCVRENAKIVRGETIARIIEAKEEQNNKNEEQVNLIYKEQDKNNYDKILEIEKAKKNNTKVEISNEFSQDKSLNMQIINEKPDETSFFLLKAEKAGKIRKHLVKSGEIINDRNTVLCVVDTIETCLHEIIVSGICSECCEVVSEEKLKNFHHVGFISNNPLIQLHKIAAFNMELEQLKQLVEMRKLCLVLDLDNTLLHASSSPPPLDLNVQIKNVNIFENASEKEETEVSNTNKKLVIIKNESENNLLEDSKETQENYVDENEKDYEKERLVYRIVIHNDFGCKTYSYYKLRPGVLSFLREISKYFELYLYTMGTADHAAHSLHLLDPKHIYFAHRVFTREDGINGMYKSLRRIFPRQEKMTLIVDDNLHPWKDFDFIEEQNNFKVCESTNNNNNSDEIIKNKKEEKEKNETISRNNQLDRVIKVHGYYYFQDFCSFEFLSIYQKIKHKIKNKNIFVGDFFHPAIYSKILTVIQSYCHLSERFLTHIRNVYGLDDDMYNEYSGKDDKTQSKNEKTKKYKLCDVNINSFGDSNLNYINVNHSKLPSANVENNINSEMSDYSSKYYHKKVCDSSNKSNNGNDSTNNCYENAKRPKKDEDEKKIEMKFDDLKNFSKNEIKQRHKITQNEILKPALSSNSGNLCFSNLYEPKKQVERYEKHENMLKKEKESYKNIESLNNNIHNEMIRKKNLLCSSSVSKQEDYGKEKDEIKGGGIIMKKLFMNRKSGRYNNCKEIIHRKEKDDQLKYLCSLLKVIHFLYYKKFDQNKKKIKDECFEKFLPDVLFFLNKIRQNVFKDCILCGIRTVSSPIFCNKNNISTVTNSNKNFSFKLPFFIFPNSCCSSCCSSCSCSSSCSSLCPSCCSSSGSSSSCSSTFSSCSSGSSSSCSSTFSSCSSGSFSSCSSTFSSCSSGSSSSCSSTFSSTFSSCSSSSSSLLSLISYQNAFRFMFDFHFCLSDFAFLSKLFGAKIQSEKFSDDLITHYITTSLRNEETKKLLINLNVHTVHLFWLEKSIYTWERICEEDFESPRLIEENFRNFWEVSSKIKTNKNNTNFNTNLLLSHDLEELFQNDFLETDEDELSSKNEKEEKEIEEEWEQFWKEFD